MLAKLLYLILVSVHYNSLITDYSQRYRNICLH